MDAIQKGYEGIYTGANVICQVAKHVGSTCLSQNIKDMYTRVGNLDFLKTFVVRPFSFTTAAHTFCRMHVLSPQMQAGMSDVAKNLKGYAEATLLATPFYKIFEFANYNGNTTSAVKDIFLGVRGNGAINANLLLESVANGAKFAKEFAEGFAFISPKLFGGLSLVGVAPMASRMVSYVISDKVACAGAAVHIYLNVKEISLVALKALVPVLAKPDFATELSPDQKKLVSKTLKAVMFSSIAGMYLFRVFSDQLAKSRVLGACNLAAIGICTGTGILLNRWNVIQDAPRRQGIVL